MTLVKICGITKLEDAIAASRFGADMLGFNFYEKSPRFIRPEDARAIVEKLPAGIGKVGVFVDDSIDRILDVVEIAGLDAIQLHGDEPPEFVDEIRTKTGLEIIKAIRLAPEGFDRSIL